MQFEVLGPIRLVNNGSSSAVRSSLRRTLLARLLLTPGRIVAVDELVEAMWGVEGWDGGHQRLWFHVSKLRSVLDEVATVERSPTGYTLLVEPDRIDAHVFEDLATKARLSSASTRDEARRHVDTALTLWRGLPYEDVMESDLVRAERRRLQQLHLSLVELGIDLRLADGQGSNLVGELEQLVIFNPFHDRFRSQLMHALWQVGRISEARLVYEAACCFADEEFGGAVSSHIQEAIERLDGGLEPAIAFDRDADDVIDLASSDLPDPARSAHLPDYQTSFLVGIECCIT